jgi:hypothetical protein
MKLLPAALGAEPKKLAILGALVGVLIVVYFVNRAPDSPASSTASPVANPSVANPSTKAAQPSPIPLANRAVDSAAPLPPQRSRRGSETSIQDFKPSLKPPEGTDVSRIDPTLRLDLIAKLRTLALEGGARSIFDFGAPPAPKDLPSVAPIKPGPAAPKPAAPPVSTTPAAPAKPSAPPIPLKFYGYVDTTSGATRRAFFLQGEDIFVAAENDVIGSHYKILRINANSAIVEDTATKNQQTLPLIEELPG